MTPLQRFFRLLKTQKQDVINIYIYALFNGMLNLSIPLGISAIINLIQSGSPSTSWMVLVGLVLLGLSLAGVFQIFQLSAAEGIQQRIFANASLEFAFRLPRLKLSALKSTYPPELVNRFFDIMTVQKGLNKFLFDFSMAAIQILFGLLLLAFYHPFFIVFGVVLILLLVGFFWFTSKRGIETSLEESKHKYRLVSWLEEIARNLSTFKMAGDTSLPMDRTDELSSKYLKARRSHFGVLRTQYGSLIVLKLIVAGSLLIIGGVLVFQQQMNIGQFVAAEIIILLITSSIEKLILSMDTIYDVLTGLEKIGGVTDLELEESVGVEKLEEQSTSLSVKADDVSLRSPQRNKQILQNISFEVGPGEKIGVTGSMGSGKSALLQLIAGLFDEFDGSIRFNGIPFKHLELESLRTAIGDNMTQEDLFEGSLFENITLLRKDLDRKEVEKVVDLCGLKGFVQDLREGIYTQLPSSGLGLAHSIKSRILMARCLVGKHGLLLIEDNWENISEERRQLWVDHLCSTETPTLFIITDDKNILTRMDRVLTMENGEIYSNEPKH